ncbi:hypothetical protein EON77_15120 [bacterium]|nr:MAG: hypothetical protein EON77_15120 [bacterium]
MTINNTGAEPMLDYRERLERDRRDAEERRERQRNDQRSTDRSPEQRVGSWERLHGLRLPNDPAHPILQVVARQTGLTVDSIRTVQSERAAAQQPAAE